MANIKETGEMLAGAYMLFHFINILSFQTTTKIESVFIFRRFGKWMKVKMIVCVKVKLQRKKNWRPPPPRAEQPEANGKEAALSDKTLVSLEKTPDDIPDGAMVQISMFVTYMQPIPIYSVCISVFN